MLEASVSNAENALIELQHIELELRNNRTHHFRHFVDQYYCYKHNYVNRSGKADWEAIVWAGIVSDEASAISDRKQVVKEHVIPLKVITSLLLERSRSGPFDLRTISEVLDRYLIFATISKREDKLLREAKLNSKMPDGFWLEGDTLYGDPLARYKAVGIPVSVKKRTGYDPQ